MENYNGNAKGLRVCAIIWLILSLIGALVGAIIVWSNSVHKGYWSSYVDGGLVALGFGILLGGSFVAILTFFLFSCIADIANESYNHDVRADIGFEKNVGVIVSGVSNALENKKGLFRSENTQQDNVADELPNL